MDAIEVTFVSWQGGKAAEHVPAKGLQGLQERGLQSRSATASLLIKNYQCMKEEM